MTVKVNDEDCVSLRNKAIHMNACYIHALVVGAASSLVRSATVRKRQQQRSDSDDPSHYRQRMITDEKYLRRTMTDTALAILTAGIASSYLYLHHDNTNDLEKEVDN